MKIWVTKYALSSGVTIEDVDPTPAYGEGTMCRRNPENGDHLLFRKDYKVSAADARKHVEVLRDKKIKSLEKQIAKLRDLKIAVPA